MKSLIVDISRQEVHLQEDKQILLSLPASTSKFGQGITEGSYCTPLGHFYLCEKYGGKAPSGTIFKGRKAIGRWHPGDAVGGDLVLTRILRLASKEPALGNTYQRYIYFHGTDQESLIGKPASHGCIRLRNEDIIKLYPLVPVGTPVNIYQ